ncbi:hypothetical protein [Paremcibacter congregatus]|uniref:hypothetical protein n=1 Tax=Paremcibacter congregatus TaxID=2043170 RepID=UPI003A8D1132
MLANKTRRGLRGRVEAVKSGGGFSMYSRTHVACSTRRNKGTCDNTLTMDRQSLESTVMEGLKSRLLEPAYFRVFCAEYTKDINRSRKAQVASLAAQRREYDKIDKEMDKLVDALCQGVPAAKIKDRMITLEQRKGDLEIILAQAAAPAPLLHPNMADAYAEKLERLTESLNDPEILTQASETLRSLLEAVILLPVGDRLEIELVGDLAGILHFVDPTKNTATDKSGRRQLPLVAGARDKLKLQTDLLPIIDPV